MAKPQYATREHRAKVKQYRHDVDSGNGWCAELVCLVEQEGGTRYIPPHDPVDAAHTTDGLGYLGPAHPGCNRSEGGKRSRGGVPIVRRLAL